MPDKQKGRASGNSKSGNRAGNIVQSNTGQDKDSKTKDEGIKPEAPGQDMSKMSHKIKK